MACYLGVDVGGTFTDLVVYDDQTGRLSVVKVPTDAVAPEEGVVGAVGASGLDLGSCRMVVHATTIATNALLTGDGLARVALVTNEGFRDILEIGRQRRPELYDPYFTRPRPLVRRAHRFTLRCRMNHRGEELEAPSAEEMDALCAKIVGAGFESVAVVFLHSYANPSHERVFGERLRRAGFEGHVSLSSEVDPYYREYERTSTTVVNAALAPRVSRYLRSLKAKLAAKGFGGELYIMCSDGGVVPVAEASAKPVSIIESGPAAGVLASAQLARRHGLRKVITFDMGGTTAKAGAVIDWQPQLVYEFEAAGKTHSGRSIKGSGYTVRHPFIELAEVSAGGGTIAWVDEAGGLRVGPRSAGASPGPAAYGRGGTEPTVTDANIVLGRLNPRGLLGSKMPIHPELAWRALGRLGERLGLGAEEAAISVVRLANSIMGRAIELVSVDRGRDPREFSIVAFGGAGPMHACDLAEEVGVSKVFVPPDPGVFSAFGLLTADFVRNFGRTVFCGPDEVEKHVSALRGEVERKLEAEGLSEFSLKEYVDVRYVGQSYELTLPYGPGLVERFAQAHREAYGYSTDDPVEVVSIRIKAIVELPKAQLGSVGAAAGPAVAAEHRRAWLAGSFFDAAVYRREQLGAGHVVEGPAIIEEYTSTTVVNPGWVCRVLGDGTLMLDRGRV